MAGILVLASCEQKKEENQNTSPKEPLQVYTPSEMALLMEQMYTHNLQQKHKIENGEDLGEYPKNINKIFEAKFTDPTDNDDFFQDHARIYIEYQKEIYDSEQPAKAHNAMIDACIQCHEVKCGGPITRIKKLYIAQ